MRVGVQWATDPPDGWVWVDSSRWEGLAAAPDPTGSTPVVDSRPGWINRLVVQGLEFTADHYAVICHGDSCSVLVWYDNAETVVGRYPYAREVVFQQLAPDPKRLNGGLNTRQLHRVWAPPGFASWLNAHGGELEVLKYELWVPPQERLIRHGVMLEDSLYALHERIRPVTDWREWTEGLSEDQLDADGKADLRWTP